MTFDQAFDRLLGHEGELSLDSSDSGNWTGGSPGIGQLNGTKFGISARSYPSLDIANLSIQDCKALFKRDFYDRIRADLFPEGLAFQLFDFAINSGPETAVRYLQRAVGVADDGVWGPVSQTAADAMSTSDLVLRLNAERLDYLTRLSGWATQGKGWARRIAGNLRYGALDV